MVGSQFQLEGLILAQPAAAASIFASDAQPSIAIVRNSDPFLAPPWRIIYRMINSAPGQAVKVMSEFHRIGETVIVAEALAQIAYDRDRLKRSSKLPISLENNVDLLARLVISKGEDWLEARLRVSVE